MSRRGGYTSAGVSSALSALNSGSTIQAGDIPVGVVDAGGGRFQRLAKGAAGTSLRVGDASGNVAYLLDKRYSPYDRGYVVESFCGEANGGNFSPTAGTIYTCKARVTEQDTIGNVLSAIHVAGSGAGTTLTNCYEGVYQWNGSNWILSGVTADLSTTWSSVGKKSVALAGGSVSVAAGDILLALLVGAGSTTGPQWMKGNVTALAGPPNGEMSGNNSFYATAGTGQTSLPSTLPAMSGTTVSLWTAAKH